MYIRGCFFSPEEGLVLIPILSLIRLYLFPPGRAIHALERVAQGATALGLDEIAAHVARAIEQFHRIKEMQTRHRTGRTNLYGRDTFVLDKQLDRALATVDSVIEGQTLLFPRGHRRAEAAITMRTALFPEGVAAITNLPYVQQRVEVDRMLAAHMDPSLAPARADLPELDVMIARVAEVNQQYGASIDAYDRDRPSAEELHAARKIGQTFLAEIVALIVARHVLSAPEQQPAVAALLEPILRQQDAIRATRRRRRPARDIDSGTGIELPAPVEQPAPVP